VFLIDNSNNLLIKKALHFLAETILMNSSHSIGIVEIDVENVINNDNFDGKDAEVEEEQILNYIETVASYSSKYLIYKVCL